MTLVPFLSGSNEHKSKPTQHSVKELQALGINPDIIITRADVPLDTGLKNKIAMFCNVKPDCVIENLTLPILYQAPIMLYDNGLDKVVCRELNLNVGEPDLKAWREMLDRINSRDKNVTIGLVGKYVKLHDAYLSIAEALAHAGYECGANIKIKWIDSETLMAKNVKSLLSGCDGILIPGGFGERGIEGKIEAAKYARENNIPYFGICLGMQIAVIEYARNVCGLNGANSTEFEENSPAPVIALMPDQTGNIPKGGTMRLGKYDCKITDGTIMRRAYKKDIISERHRHRYEFNNDYRTAISDKGMIFSGVSPDKKIIETVEIPDRKFFIGVQFHPEFKSRPNHAHPLFLEFIKSCL